MEQNQDIAITVLQRQVDANDEAIQGLMEENERLRAAIGQLQSPAHAMNAAPPYTKDGDLAVLLGYLEHAALTGEFESENFEGLGRIDVAKKIARRFEGYITVTAFKKILADSGVMRGTAQVASLASRVLKNSEEFVRISEGLYRLKDYRPKDQEAPEEAS
jgi:hypothetical protein